MTTREVWRRAQNCIAQNALTNSKRPSCFVNGVYPKYLKHGKGCYVWDHDGNRYADFITGLGTNLLGYGHESVSMAIAAQLGNGACLSLGTHHEVDAAESVKSFFPFVQSLKFLKTGTEACAAAIRIARAHTGRDLVLSEAYHGWSDAFVSLTPPALGVPKTNLRIKKLSEYPIDDTVAAVIVEAVITDWSQQRNLELNALRDACTKAGALLIFDEVITGYRFSRHSVSTLFNINPDIICLGKAIANGMPLAVVGGSYAIMNGTEYFVSSSYAGETYSLAAANEVMRLLRTRYDIESLWSKGKSFIDEFNSIFNGLVWIEGYPTRGVLKAKDDYSKAIFMQEACLGGMLFGPSWFFNFPLADEAAKILPVLKDVALKIKTGNVKLLGDMPSSPFAQRMREK